jgi:hypothetical protein
LEQISSTGRIDATALEVLEKEPWWTRAWTYQEIVNSRVTHFIAEGGSSVSISANKALDCVGQAIANFRKDKGYDSFTFRTKYPSVDSLEDVIADYMTRDYLDRSAYQAMSVMEARDSTYPDDLLNGMIGAITVASPDDPGDLSPHPAEYFMRICEDKGDYSFIYSTATRSDISGRLWRPVAGPLHAILPWHSSGTGQSGGIYPTHLQLNNMCRMNPGTISSSARLFLGQFLQVDDAVSSSANITALIIRRLKDAGFKGCGEHIELEAGYFFPQESLLHMDKVVVAVTTEVQWVFGAPGLLMTESDSNIHSYRGVGIFVGPVPEVGHSINVG